MNDSPSNSALRRKAQVGQQQYQARSMTALRALRLSLQKVAEDEFALALGVIGLTEMQAGAEDVIGRLGPGSLMILLETQNGGPGGVILDANVVDGLVQQQTMGKVFEAPPDQPPRKVTRTDAALIGPYLDLVFRRAGLMPDLDLDRKLLSGVKFGAHMPAARLLVTALEAMHYHHFSVTVDLATGKRQGRIDFLLPRALTGREMALEAPGDRHEGGVAKTLEPLVMNLPAHLRVALCRMRLPLTEISKFKPGDVLTLPPGAVRGAEILTLDGRKVGQGKLGQVEGRRALKIGTQFQSGEALQRRAADRPEGVPLIAYGGEDRDGGGSPVGAATRLPPPKADHAEDDFPDLPPIMSSADMDFPDLPDLPELPDLPSMPGEAGAGDALPDLPELPDLPDLPDLPPLT